MIKKYEIINDGGKKRIKALRSFHVQGRYVNIGDVGGIVYDENTLSQEGNCWIFSGNLNYPSIRVGGDSIVDTNGYEADVTDPRPFVNVTGTSALIGAHEFVTGKTTTAKVLAVGDVERGNVAAVVGSKYEESKSVDATVLRVNATLYRGNTKTTVKVGNPDYQIKVLKYDVNGLLFSASPDWITGGSDTAVTTEDCYYYAVLVRKTVGGAIALSEITTAAVEVSEPVTECTAHISDSRIDFAFTGAVAAVRVNPGGLAPSKPDSRYPETVIRNSRVLVNVSAGSVKIFRIMGNIIESNVTVDAATAETQIGGIYIGVKNLMVSGAISAGKGVPVYNAIRAASCDNFTLSPAVFPGYAEGVAASMPFIFTRCNVPGGRFYHNAKIKNTYTDIDFSKAQKDLGKISGNYYMSSSEVEGMYRVYHVAGKKFGALVESYDSIKAANFSDLATMVATTIYKDAKLTGLFNISGTNVFGGTGNHGGGKGCEITNTKETAMVISGNVRVEGNATVKDVSITGTGYFGGDSVTEAPAALAAPMPIEGVVYMSDKAVFAPSTVGDNVGVSMLEMRGNAMCVGGATVGGTRIDITMADNARFLGTLGSNIGFNMQGNSFVAAGGVVASTCRGRLVMKDDARIENGAITTLGRITLCGKYKQTTAKTWTGKRTITDVNSPTYDNNVKTKYDF